MRAWIALVSPSCWIVAPNNSAVAVADDSSGRCAFPDLDAPRRPRSLEQQGIEREATHRKGIADGARVLRLPHDRSPVATLEDVLAGQRRRPQRERAIENPEAIEDRKEAGTAKEVR